MIKKSDYLKAKSIIDAYENQQSELKVLAEIQREQKQKKREAECGEHYFLPMGKWQGASAMKCQDCGKVIE